MQKLSGNQLKIIAAVCMTVDHIGLMLFPECVLLRIIGRLALPLFAYMIAEGCRYTKNRARYLGGIAGLAIVMQVIYYFMLHSLYQCILVTFSFSIGLIYSIEYAVKQRRVWAWGLPGILLAIVLVATLRLPIWLRGTDYAIDYGLWGVLLPVGVYFGKRRETQLVFCAVCIAFLTRTYGTLQGFSLLALPFLACYSGERGKLNMKYFFYIYFPAHLVVLWLLRFVV